MHIGSQVGRKAGMMQAPIPDTIYPLGPLTQALITINRFLIVYFAPIVIPWYSKWITFGSLSACWIIAAYFSTLIGFPGTQIQLLLIFQVSYISESCLIRFSHQSLTWVHDECPYFINYILQSDFLFLVLPLAIFSNVMNVFIAIKLFLSSVGYFYQTLS